MKKISVILAFLFAFFLLVPQVQALEVVKEKVIASQQPNLIVTKTRDVPPLPLTSEEAKKIAGDASKKTVAGTVAGIEKLNKQLIEKKDTETATAINSQTDSIKDLGGKVGKLGGKMDDLTGKDGALTKIAADTKKTSEQTRFNKLYIWILAGLAVVIAIIGCLIAIFGKKTEKTVIQESAIKNQDLQTMERNILQSIEDHHVDTRNMVIKGVKEKEPITVDFEICGRKVYYTPTIVNNMYISLYVPKQQSEEVDDPAKIIRLPQETRGKIYKSTLSVMADFFEEEDGKKPSSDDGYSRNQLKVVLLAKSQKQLKFEKIAA